MLYHIVKLLHVVGASLLCGAALFSLCLLAIMKRSWQANSARRLLHMIIGINWLLIIPLGLLELFSGFSIISIQHYSLHKSWVDGTIIGFIVLSACYLTSLLCMMRCAFVAQQQPQRFLGNTTFKHALRSSQQLMLPAFGALIVIIFLMSNR